MHLGTSIQISPFPKFYVIPHADYLSAGRGYFDDYIKSAFLPKYKWSEENSSEASYLFSIGTTFSYNSIIGPINIDLTGLGGTGSKKVHFYLGLGLFMPISK